MLKARSRNIPFDHDNPKYACCCDAIHVKLGAYVIASISAFLIISNFVLKAIGVSTIAWNWELLFLVIDSVAVLCLLQGLFQEKAALLQPFVVLSLGAYVIASISAFLIISNFVLKAIGVSTIAWNWELLFLVIDSVAVLCLLQGLFQEKAALLQPFVVLSVSALPVLLFIQIQ
uniref:Transmembrane protein n=1 Tax=Ascaris lumbricoides TaxID=6252 RepID=A0A0M3IS89_ASCLU